MFDGEIQHFDGEIGILDGEQQKNMIVNSQFLMVSFLNFNLVVLNFCSSCLNPHNWASFQHAIFVCRWHKFLMWVSMWYMWWCLREVAKYLHCCASRTLDAPSSCFALQSLEASQAKGSKASKRQGPRAADARRRDAAARLLSSHCVRNCNG